MFSTLFTVSCTGFGSFATVQGVLRWHAHDSVEAITTSSGPQDYGQVATNGQSPASTVTLYNAGSLAQPLGTAALSGANASWFVITADTCSGVTLQPGSTCTVGVAAAPKAAGNSDINRLVVPSSVPAGAVALNLRVSGIDKPPAPTMAAAAGYRSVTLTWQNQAGSTARSHTVYRGSAPDALTVLAQLPAALPSSARYVDSTGTPGVTYYYAVSDANIAGQHHDRRRRHTPDDRPYASTGSQRGVDHGCWERHASGGDCLRRCEVRFAGSGGWRAGNR